MLAKPSTTRTDGLPAPADTKAKVDGQTSPTPKEEVKEEKEYEGQTEGQVAVEGQERVREEGGDNNKMMGV